MTDKDKNNPEEEGGVATLTKPKTKEPSMYKIVMLNDDYTTMEFVISVLKNFFHKTYDEANKIMLAVHHKGKGICGIYPYDVASTKIMQVHEHAKKNDAPLRCLLEKA
ncbi:ATP-dependent Clp protease adapter ClpS [bacterium K02(2017)]|nr:ATP-dependent Clp protease adapter ClpS [bacterium K02(2017)]